MNVKVETVAAATEPTEPEQGPLTEMERLAVAQAVFKAVSEAVSTKDPDSLRGRMDDRVVQGYLDTGAKSLDVRVAGTKVGTYTVRVSKEQHRTDLVVRDRDAFAAWCAENGLAKPKVVWDARVPEAPMGDEGRAIELLVRTGVLAPRTVIEVGSLAEAGARIHMQETGEVPGGCEAVAVDEPSRPIGTTLKVDPALVARALKGRLPSAAAGLLEAAS